MDYRLEQYYYFKSDLFAKLGVRYEEERADGDNFDYRGYGIEGSVSIPVARVPFVRTMAINLMAGYLFRDYDNPNSIFTDASGRGIERGDGRMTYRAEIVGQITSYLSLSLRWTNVWNDSNITFYEYRRNVYGFNVIFKF